MTIEEIEMRKIIKEMLSDVGTNRETIDQAVKDIINKKVDEVLAQEAALTVQKELVTDLIKDEMKNFRISVEIKRDTQNEKD